MRRVPSSKQKETREALQELRQQLVEGIVASATDAMIAFDDQQRVVLLNPAAERMFQVTATEAVGEPLDRLIPESFRMVHGKAEEADRPNAGEGQKNALKVVKGSRADSGEFPAESSISQFEAGGRKFFTAIVRDISKRLRAEDALRETGQRLSLAVETAKLGTYERDLRTNEVRLNPVCREILGLPPGPLPPEPAKRSVHPEDKERVLAVVARAFDPALREVCAAEFRILRPDGTVRWVEGRGRVMFDEKTTPAQPQKFLGVLRDITDRKLAEEELRRAERALAVTNAELEQRVQERTAKLKEMIAELEHMSYSMIHDMRAPLRAIQSYGGILERDPQIRLSAEARELVERMRTTSLRMDQLLTGALNYNEAVRKPYSVGPTNALQLLRDLLTAHPEFRPPHGEVIFEGKFPLVAGNEAGLAQCFAELIRNGLKFVEPGKLPRVRVWTKRVLHPDKAGDWVRVYFEDNGTGIPESGQGKIFDMFQRVHGPEYPGTGIGLALVRKVTEHMGGRVGVESEEGKGSRFWLELPRLPGSQKNAPFRLAA